MARGRLQERERDRQTGLTKRNVICSREPCPKVSMLLSFRLVATNLTLDLLLFVLSNSCSTGRKGFRHVCEGIRWTPNGK